MVKATFEIAESGNRVLTIVKGKYGLKNKEQALALILDSYEKSLEPEIRPEYLDELKKIEKGKFHRFKGIDDLSRQIEG